MKILVLKNYVLVVLRIVLCYAECVHVEQYYAQGCVVIRKYECIQSMECPHHVDVLCYCIVLILIQLYILVDIRKN
jgi:hypothetical protein